MPRVSSLVALLSALVIVDTRAQEVDNLRIATYNIKFLDAATIGSQGDRQSKLKDVITLLDADIIALQEIDDRAALKKIFSTNDWQLIIDDDSGDDQDVALAVRRPRAVYGFGGNDFDADDEHFLFPSSADNDKFPNRRDVLCVGIEIPDDTLWVLVIHAKSRFGGRALTDPRREAAAVALINKLVERFDERRYVVLGDFNDNADDRSLNILESGDPSAVGVAENDPGAFLVNLTEALLLDEHVSHGRNTLDIEGDRVETRDPGSRPRNNDARGTNANTGDILFDQVLIPPRMMDSYVQGSVAVFDRAVAAKGNDKSRASDHLPVFAEFAFTSEQPGVASLSDVRIVSVLPNPNGPDAGHEVITLRNEGSSVVDLTGWRIVDRAGNTVTLSETVGPNATRDIVFSGEPAFLNNDGDEIALVDTGGRTVHRVSYGGDAVSPGVAIATSDQ